MLKNNTYRVVIQKRSDDLSKTYYKFITVKMLAFN